MAHEGHDHDHDHEHGDHEHHGHAHEHHGHAHEHHGHAHEHHDHTHEHHHAEAHAHHGHDDHEHPHAHDDTLAGPPLARGAGKGKVLFLDAFSGIAGDMTIAALADLGVPHAVVDEAVAAVGLTGFHLHRGHKHDSSIVASTFDVYVEGRQPERTLRSIDDMIAASSLAPDVKALARAIFRRLGEAEAAVHKMPIDDVHFHEVGAVDAIVDIVGSAASFVYLGAHVLASPLPTGRGFVKARHGILPLPAPAVVTCLRGIPTYEVPLDRELVTPTGAAIVATVAQGFVRWPSFAPERVGWGAGTQTLPDRPNLLRAVLGEPTTPTGPTTTDTTQATHVVLEANVDDMTGEVAAHAIEALLAAGALDAWASPITMKKGRPALCLSALATLDAEARITAALLTETTSIGVRRSPVSRTVRPRRTVTVSTVYGEIPVKISEGPYGPPQTKPEFDACARAAREHGVPVRAVIAAALARLP